MHLGCVENRDAVLSDGVHYHMGVYGRSETGEIHQILEGGSLDNVEVRDVKVFPKLNERFKFVKIEDAIGNNLHWEHDKVWEIKKYIA